MIVPPPASDPNERIEDIIAYLMPMALGGLQPIWPPDAFAITATILKRSGTYCDVANAWPPAGCDTTDDWNALVTRVADEWRAACNSGAPWPDDINALWAEIILQRGMRLSEIKPSEAVFIALVGIAMTADQTCRGIGFFNGAAAKAMDFQAIQNLRANNTLCDQVHRSRASVFPKAHNPVSGMTLRSLTHNVALWDRPEVTPSWHSILTKEFAGKRSMNMLLLPWPLTLNPSSFYPAAYVEGLRLPSHEGLFRYDVAFDDGIIPRIRDLVTRARTITGSVDAIVFPELSMAPENFQRLQTDVQEHFGIPLLIAGTGTAADNRLSSNEVRVSVDPSTTPYTQSKHHRWRLDRKQTSNYGITRLSKKDGGWWEAIHIEQRACRFFNANEWLTFCVLICEDLARQDPVSELVRSVGPSLVIALLLDGPQIAGRWPANYATVLAEDPRSSVLTLTSAGMVDLARVNYGGGPRSVGLWKDAIAATNRQLILEPGKDGILLNIVQKMEKEWAADGRHDRGKSGYAVLAGIYQV